MLVVDMHAPGVEVRPLRQMTGGATFNEVFFDEVRVPDSHRLGDVDEGWTVALTTLMNERAAIGGGGAGVGTMSFTRFVELARNLGVADDPLIRQRLADVYIRTQRRAVHEPARRWRRSAPVSSPGPRCRSASSRSPRTCSASAQLLGEMLGPRLAADSGEWGTYAWSRVRARRPGHARRRRHRRDHAQHRRRARARPPQGAQARVARQASGQAGWVSKRPRP